jgi:hypothetical protein
LWSGRFARCPEDLVGAKPWIPWVSKKEKKKKRKKEESDEHVVGLYSPILGYTDRRKWQTGNYFV